MKGFCWGQWRRDEDIYGVIQDGDLHRFSHWKKSHWNQGSVINHYHIRFRLKLLM